MNNESRQHCTPLRNAVDPSIVRVLRLLEPTARSADCEYFVAGATARDVDFGVAVESWAQFELLKERLIATREFAAAPKVQQRLIYTDQTAGFSIPVDLIPFRGIESADGTFAWPPDRDIVMNVAGFEEAALESSGLI